MKKQYQSPEIEKITLETAEPVTAWLGFASNPFLKLAFEDEAEEQLTAKEL